VADRRPNVVRSLAEFDPDCRTQTLETRRRADIVVVFHAIARIAERVRRS